MSLVTQTTYNNITANKNMMGLDGMHVWADTCAIFHEKHQAVAFIAIGPNVQDRNHTSNMLRNIELY